MSHRRTSGNQTLDLALNFGTEDTGGLEQLYPMTSLASRLTLILLELSSLTLLLSFTSAMEMLCTGSCAPCVSHKPMLCF